VARSGAADTDEPARHRRPRATPTTPRDTRPACRDRPPMSPHTLSTDDPARHRRRGV